MIMKPLNFQSPTMQMPSKGAETDLANCKLQKLVNQHGLPGGLLQPQPGLSVACYHEGLYKYLTI